MSNTTVIEPEPVQALAVREETTTALAPIESATSTHTTPQQARVDAVANLTFKAYEKASQLDLTEDERKALQEDFPDDAFRTGANGKENLIYIEHAHLRDRLNKVLGPGQWSIIPRNRWAEDFTFVNKYNKTVEASRVYVEAMLLIRGCFVAEAVGDMVYYKNNEGQNYGDAVEGAKSAALRRCAKELGIGLQAWKEKFSEGWMQRRNGKSCPIPPTSTFRQAAPPPTPKAPEPPPKAEPVKASDKWIQEYREGCRKHLFQKIEDKTLQADAWEFFRAQGWILASDDTGKGETYDCATATVLFPGVVFGQTKEEAIAASQVDFRRIMQSIEPGGPEEQIPGVEAPAPAPEPAQVADKPMLVPEGAQITEPVVIKEIYEDHGNNKKTGNPWTKYTAQTVAGTKFTTFSDTVGEKAIEAKRHGKPVKLIYLTEDYKGKPQFKLHDIQ